MIGVRKPDSANPKSNKISAIALTFSEKRTFYLLSNAVPKVAERTGKKCGTQKMWNAKIVQRKNCATQKLCKGKKCATQKMCNAKNVRRKKCATQKMCNAKKCATQKMCNAKKDPHESSAPWIVVVPNTWLHDKIETNGGRCVVQ